LIKEENGFKNSYKCINLAMFQKNQLIFISKKMIKLSKMMDLKIKKTKEKEKRLKMEARVRRMRYRSF
jgi:hypothetical protein